MLPITAADDSLVISAINNLAEELRLLRATLSPLCTKVNRHEVIINSTAACIAIILPICITIWLAK